MIGTKLTCQVHAALKISKPLFQTWAPWNTEPSRNQHVTQFTSVVRHLGVTRDQLLENSNP